MPPESSSLFYPFLIIGVVGLDETRPIVRVIAYHDILQLALHDPTVKQLLHDLLDKAMEGAKPPDDRPKDVTVTLFRESHEP